MSSIHSNAAKMQSTFRVSQRQLHKAADIAITARHVGEPQESRPQDALLYDMDLPLCKTFYPLGYAVEIVTNNLDVLKAAEASFGHRRLRRGTAALRIHIGITDEANSACPSEPTRREYNHLYSLVADARNQALLDLKTCTSFAWLSKAALNNELYFRYNFLEKVVYLLLGASVVTDIHGACIGKRGRGILLCGDSGAGKSTLAYACARAGWTYTSDDTSYLINDSLVPRIIGHAHRIRFRPAAKTQFPELADFAVTPRMEGKPSIEVPTDQLPILKTAAETHLHSIVYLNRHAASKAKLVPLPTGTATLRMRKELFSAGEIRAKHETVLGALFDVPTYELQYYGLNDAISRLEDLVNTV